MWAVIVCERMGADFRFLLQSEAPFAIDMCARNQLSSLPLSNDGDIWFQSDAHAVVRYLWIKGKKTFFLLFPFAMAFMHDLMSSSMRTNTTHKLCAGHRSMAQSWVKPFSYTIYFCADVFIIVIIKLLKRDPRKLID